MPASPMPAAPAEQDPLEATLVFHEQADGRKIARLPGGKVLLVDLIFYLEEHRDTLARADRGAAAPST